MTRIIDKIHQRKKQANSAPRALTCHDQTKMTSGAPVGWYYSFEFFPPKTEAGLDNLITRIDRMTRRLDPIFIDVTWGGISTASRTMAIASHAQKYLGVDVLLHLTAQGMTRSELARYLEQARASGIHNILALRGDPPRGKQSWQVGEVSGGECDRAIDLVQLIRELHGEYFGIAVAGHPEGHPSSVSPEEEMCHLKAKIDAGADFIITQFFYDTSVFYQFVKRCRQVGIECPILPGVMPIQSFSSFVRMTDYCQISVPAELMARLERVKKDDEAVKAIGLDYAINMCKSILTDAPGGVDGVHFYTLNLERSVTQILAGMGAVDFIRPTGNVSLVNDPVRAASVRPLPWRPSAMEKRSRLEQVRPINWANRPMSYVMRTEDWDEFPNGRWGDATSPAFGELSDLSHFYSFSLGSDDDQRAMLGENPSTLSDIYEVFARYVEGRVPHIPWCETPLQPESFRIQSQLAFLNRAGFLTINSQPAVNMAPSSDKTFGWGGLGGYIYQKAYCECFSSPENTMKLAEIVKKVPSLNLYAVNQRGEEIREGTFPGGVTALTWGVFPNREIIQPTIFDPNTFLVWAEEAFSLWTTLWLRLYDYESPSYELIQGVRDSFYLCAIIDNDFSTTEEDVSSMWKAMMEVATASTGSSES